MPTIEQYMTALRAQVEKASPQGIGESQEFFLREARKLAVAFMETEDMTEEEAVEATRTAVLDLSHAVTMTNYLKDGQHRARW